MPEVESRNLTGKEASKVMMIPVRCFSCGGVIGDKWEEYARRVQNGEDSGRVLDDLGVTRYCCRRMLLSNIEIADEILKYYEEAAKRRKELETY